MTRDASFSAADTRGPLAPSDLKAVVDFGDGRELAAVAGDDGGHTEAARRGCRDEPGRKRPVAVDDIERAVVSQRRQERPVLPQHAGGPPEVANRRTEERVGARLLVVAQRVDEHVVLPRQPLDQPQQGGNHLLAAASVDAAGHDEGDAHERPLFHTRP